MYVSPRRSVINLAAMPLIRHAGINTHGHVRVEKYAPLGIWSLHLYRYRGRLRVDDQWHDIQPGRASFLAPDADLEYHYEGLSVHACAHFTPTPSSSPAPASLPVMQDLGQSFASLYKQMEQLVAWHPTNPARASVRLCDLLWRLGDASTADHRAASSHPAPGAPHPAVRRALELIELRLARPIYVPDLARELDLSHNHLTRLFRSATGTTIATHIARRRVDRARDLLQHTRLPIKSVAAHVGIPDLQQFNKLIHRVLGAPPSAVRAGFPTNGGRGGGA